MKKKICFIIPTLSTGGMERVVAHLLNTLSTDQGISCTVILISQHKIDFFLSENVEIRFIKCIDIKSSSFKKNLVWAKGMIRLRCVLKNAKYDSICSFGLKYNLMTILVSLGLKSKIVVSDRSSPVKEEGALYEFLRKRLYPLTDVVVAQTTTAKTIFLKKYRHNNVVVIPNPIEAFDINYLPDNKIIVTIGRLVEEKNLMELIDILKESNFSKNKDWKMHVIGDGYLFQSLKEKIEYETMGEQIKLLGRLSPIEIEQQLKIATLFLFTSKSEGYPNSLSEAVKSGIPAIAYNCIAGPEDIIVDGKNGFLVALYDKYNYITCLNRLMEDRELRIAMNQYSLNADHIKSIHDISTLWKGIL